MGLVAADAVEDASLVVPQNGVDLRELAVLLSSEMEHQAWLASHRHVAQETTFVSKDAALQHAQAELEQREQELHRLRQDLRTAREARDRFENDLRLAAGIQNDLRQAKEELRLAAETRRENELALETANATLRKVKDELRACEQELRTKDEGILQAQAEVGSLHLQTKKLSEDIDHQRSDLRRVQAELDLSIGQNGRLLKEISQAKSDLQVVLKVQQSNEIALTAKEAALNDVTLKLDVCIKDLCAEREEKRALEKVMSKLGEENDHQNMELERALEQQRAFEEEAERIRCERDGLITRLEQINAKLQKSDLDLSYARGRLREKEREEDSTYDKDNNWASGAQHGAPATCVDWMELVKNLPKHIAMATGIYMAMVPYFRRWGRVGNGIAIVLTLLIASAYILLASHMHTR